jgi:hypothetical protein
MAKGNRTTSTPRRATAAKAGKAPRKGAIQWGYDKGRLIVVQAPGRWANELPAGRWCLLRDTVTDLQDVANGINSLRAYPAGDVADAMLAVAARGSSLIEDLIENARAFVAMSPKLREAVAKVEHKQSGPSTNVAVVGRGIDGSARRHIQARPEINAHASPSSSRITRESSRSLALPQRRGFGPLLVRPRPVFYSCCMFREPSLHLGE